MSDALCCVSCHVMSLCVLMRMLLSVAVLCVCAVCAVCVLCVCFVCVSVVRHQVGSYPTP